MITLYELPVSSYCCKLRVVLSHKNLAWRSAPPPDGYGSSAYCSIIPSGTIPAIDHDGFRLAESDAIAEYIDEIVPQPPMLPADPAQRARARELLHCHNGRIEPLLRACFAHVSPAVRHSGFLASNAAQLQKRLEQLARMARPAPLLLGDQLMIADCAFVPSFVLLDVLPRTLGFTIAMPSVLRDYRQSLVAHPSVADHSAAYYDSLDEWVASKTSGGG